MGTGRSNKHFEFKENYEDAVDEDPELENYDKMMEDAKAFAFGEKSRNKPLEVNVPERILMTQGDADNSFGTMKQDKSRNKAKRIGILMD